MSFTNETFYAMGVAAPIPNYRFIQGSIVEGTLNGSHENINTLTINTTSPDIRFYVVGYDDYPLFPDKVIIGPSSYDDEHQPKGATEEWIIRDATSSTSLTLLRKENETTLRYKYKDGDPFTIYSHRFPQGWTTTNDYGNIITYPLNQFVPEENIFFGERSMFDDFSFNMKMTCNWIPLINDVNVSLSLGDILKSNTVYRLGIRYKGYCEISKYTYLYVDAEDSITEDRIRISKTSGWATNVDDAEWNEDTGYGLFSGTEDTSDLNITITTHYETTDARPLYLKFDYIFLEHAAETSGEDEGVYTFTEQPAMGSTGYTFRETADEHSDIQYKSKRFNWYGMFENVSTSFYKNLMVLDYYQKLGHKMFFHTNEEFGSNLPPLLKGIFKISNLTQKHWDPKRLSFRFDFLEE